VLKQGRIVDDGFLDCKMEEMRIPEDYVQTGNSDFAVIKLGECVDDEGRKAWPQQKWAFQVTDFIPAQNPKGTKYDLPGYGGRRTLQVTSLAIYGRDEHYNWVHVQGASRPGDSGAPILNAAGKIVGVHRGAPRKITIAEEKKGPNGEVILPKLKDYPPMFTPLIASRIMLIAKMMVGTYGADEVQSVRFAAHSNWDNVAFYEEETDRDGDYEEFLLYDEALRDLERAQKDFAAAQRLLNGERSSKKIVAH